MFDTQGDALPTWVALTLVAGTALAAVAAVPSTPTPDATAVANAADAVTAGDHAAARTVPTTATTVRVRSASVALRNDAGTTHATFARPITPADTPALRRVLRGASPSVVYPTLGDFRADVRRARASGTEAGWRPCADSLTARRVRLGGGDVTLLG
ncbi:hypothetical protein J2752_002085 [Halarchaeum rubridurum]|uniref:Uncharacterized protein n=1 Tax=Halarchaeum rubridurum TaxID=489911 RepID=A0A830FZW2_9EURY|nr:hypothetical protein [Halarchaeum rubridurum]MBP1955173.1 hypothetical protein [Halarchaeum rubridurum]GGM68357.1 hypothetical protein GCM10009017_18220 [Halarchaeum rubridurum]